MRKEVNNDWQIVNNHYVIDSVAVFESTFRIWSTDRTIAWFVSLLIIPFLNVSSQILLPFLCIFTLLLIDSIIDNHKFEMFYTTDYIIIMWLVNIFRQPSSLKRYRIHNKWRIIHSWPLNSAGVRGADSCTVENLHMTFDPPET